ncbi:MAG: cytochrome c-type biogenesis protein [Anaerolineales bacterium]
MRKDIYHLSWIIMGLVFWALMNPLPGFAQEPTPPDDEVNEIAKQLYCPVCENTPLDACGTVACEQWRGVIREKLSQGWTEQEIKDYFVEQYGDRVLAEPPKRGFNWLAYIVPPAAFLIGAYVLYRGFVTWKARDRDLPPDSEKDLEDRPDIDPEYISRVNEELRKR